jgi:outer membrane protein OmpA-like peptidoglycan-associated protein/opacity protein-like surface antigen
MEKQSVDLYGDTGLGAIPDGTRIARFKFKTGWMGGGVFGYAFDSGLRPEIELSYRDNKLDKDSVADAQVDGHERAKAAMGNLWFDLGKSSTIRPYIGGGAGYAQIRFHNVRYPDAGVDIPNDHDEKFAWQAGAGVNMDLGEHVALGLGYRYFRTDKGRFDFLDDGVTHTKARYASQSALLSLTAFFGGEPKAEPAPAPAPPPQPVAVAPAPPPPPPLPPPAPPPCASPENGARVSLEGCKTGDVIVLRGVNFEFNKSTLTVNAQSILDQVADELQKRPDVNIALEGHTDSVGSDTYNQSLSTRRAQSVRQYLVKKGVAASRMTASGMGESNPVADNNTDAGRELNRRVEMKVTSGSPGVSVAPMPGGGSPQ